MPPVEPELPVPRRRLWRTKLRWSRDVTRFAPPIAIDPAIANEIPERELSHWGEVALLEDYLTVLHRDGTVTYRRSWLFVLHGVKQMERWERFKYHFDCRAVKYTVRRARVHWADGNQRLATITNRAVDRHGYSRLLEVQFKRLAPGAVVDVEDQQDNFAPFSHCPGVCADFALHSTYPCKRRRITLAVAAPFTVRHELHHGAPDPSQRQVGDYQVLCWDLHDLPGIEWDELTPPLYEFAPWIDFSTLPNWEPVAKFYIAELKLLAYHHDLGTLARRLARAGAGTDSRLAAAYNYVARDVRYGRPKANSHDWEIRPLGAITEELRGDCKDKSALLVGLLGKLEIDAEVVLVRTAKVGRVGLLPGSRFDHAVVRAHVDGKDVWLDPAAPAYTLGQLPAYDQGVQGLILNRHEPHPISTPDPRPTDHHLKRIVRGKLAADGSIRGEARITLAGDGASGWRSGLIERNAHMRERTLRQYAASSFPSAQITDLKVECLDELHSDMVIVHDLVVPRLARRIQDLLLLRIPWYDNMKGTGFFAAGSRPQPMFALIRQIVDRLEFELPDGFVGYNLPLEFAESCAWGSYVCTAKIENGVLLAERELQLFGGNIPPAQYDELRRFLEACVDADTSDIVLTKGNKPGL